jgi:hypothetical protein
MRRAARRRMEHGPGMGSQASPAGAHVMGGSERRAKAVVVRRNASAAGDRAIDSVGPFGRVRPTNVGMRMIGQLTHCIIVDICIY